MIRGATLLWGVLVLAVGTGLFMLKHEVQELEDKLTRLNHEIRSDRAAVHVLEAEWSYLNDPARLRDLAERHLGLAPFAPAQVNTLAQLPLRPPPPPRPEGEAAPPPGPVPGAGTGAPVPMVRLPAAPGVPAAKAEIAGVPGRTTP